MNGLAQIKKCLLLITLCCASEVWAVEVDADFYGRLNIAYDWNDADLSSADDDWESYVSRVGVKGEYALSSDVKVVYQLEQEVDVIHGGKNRKTLFSTRNSYIGLEGTYGRVFFGAHDTPLKKAQGKVDVFNDQSADIKSLFPGEVRAKDSFGYHSPKWQGWQLTSLYVPSDSHFGSSKSLGVIYKSEVWNFGFAIDDEMRKNDRAVARTRVYDSYRGSVQYRVNDWRFGFIAQSSEQQNLVGASRESGYLASVSYQLGKFKYIAQHGRSDIVAQDVRSSGLGAEYKLEKNTKIYMHYWDYDNGNEQTSVSLGVEHKF